MSLARVTSTPLRAMTSSRMAPKHTAVFMAAPGEKTSPSWADTSIWNRDRGRADSPDEAAEPKISPANREMRPVTTVSRISSRDTCPGLMPSSR